MNGFKLYPTSKMPAAISPGTRKRDWFQPHTYRCLPLTVANSLGWDILAPDDIYIKTDSKGEIEYVRGPAKDHFGMGTFTIEIGYVWKSEPNTELLIMPVPNQVPKDWIAMSAVIETAVLNYPWFLTCKTLGADKEFIIPKDTPLCRILPIEIARIENTSISIEPMSDDIDKDVKSFKGVRDDQEAGSWTRYYHSKVRHPRVRSPHVINNTSQDDPREIMNAAGILILPNLLSPEQCSYLIKVWHETEKSDKENSFWIEKMRQPEKVDLEIEKLLKDFIVDKASSYYKEQLWRRAFNIVRWLPGQSMPAHTDHGSNREFPYRKYAVVAYLNDNYEGGNLYFPKLNIELKVATGNVVIFPGGDLWHGVSEITEGERYTATAWLGPVPPPKET